MSRISKLLLKLSFTKIIVSVSLLAQYSHFPVTSSQINEIESKKFPNFTSEFNSFADVTDSSIFDSWTVSDFHSDLIESSPDLKISNAHSDESTTVDVGISSSSSLNHESNFAYIQNLPDAQTIISPDSPDLISDIIYFLKDLFDEDGNYSEENFFGQLDHKLAFPYFANYLIKSNRNSQITPNSLHRLLKQIPTTFPLTSKTQDLPLNYINRSETPLPAEKNSYNPPFSFNVFNLEDDFNTISVNDSDQLLSKRNRRAFTPTLDTSSNWTDAYAFDWNISVFDPTSPNNEAVFAFNGSKLGNLSSSDMNLTINGPPSGGVGNLSVFAYGHIGGGNWQDYSTNNGFLFMTGSGGPANGNVTSHFNLDTSGIDAYINAGGHNSFTWGVHREGINFYLTYDFDESSLAYSSTPEPSTYVMTGALLCFIGFNPRSRKSVKKIFNLLSNKLNLPNCIEKLTKSQSHS